jgi:antitoxin component of RelBE/YafQ-DinJ toxin-antitoxin module
VLAGGTQDSAIDTQLRESIVRRGFVAIGASPHKLDDAAAALAQRYGVAVVDVTRTLLARMHQLADENSIPWGVVLQADAANPNSPDGQSLRALVADAIQAVNEALAAAERPVLLTEAAPLARYGHVGMLERLADHTTARRAAVWLLVPTTNQDLRPKLDGRSVSVLSSAQWLKLPDYWISSSLSFVA